MKILLAAALAAALASPVAAATLTGKPPVVIAHRGASGYLPEHTLAAYELAIKMGVDYIEPDLALTKDGVPIAMHDDDLLRTTNVRDKFPGRPSYHASDFTLAEIKTLTVSTGKPTSYPGFTPRDGSLSVPTFAEVIALAKAAGAERGRPVGLYPETKINTPALEDAVIATLKAEGYTGKDSPIFIQTFHKDQAIRIEAKLASEGMALPVVQLGRAVKRGDVWGVGLNSLTFVSLQELADLGFEGIGLQMKKPNYPYPGLSDVTAELIDAAHKLGLAVHGWTFNKTGYKAAYAMGIDGVFSNYPDLALKARPAPVPLPAGGALMLGALAALGLARRR